MYKNDVLRKMKGLKGLLKTKFTQPAQKVSRFFYGIAILNQLIEVV